MNQGNNNPGDKDEIKTPGMGGSSTQEGSDNSAGNRMGGEDSSRNGSEDQDKNQGEDRNEDGATGQMGQGWSNQNRQGGSTEEKKEDDQSTGNNA